MTGKLSLFCAFIAVSMLACASEAPVPEAAPVAPVVPVEPVAAPVAPPAPPALRDAVGNLTQAGLDAAWKEVFIGNANAALPTEEKMAAFEAKVGAPASKDGDTRVWWAYEGTDCFKVELGKDGTKGKEKVTAEKCGK